MLFCEQWERPRSRRRGLTRVDVILLLVMAAVIAGLFITYVGGRRELANQEVCADNFRRIGLGMLKFHEDKGYLPAARIAPDYATWSVQIADYLRNDSGLTEWDQGKPYAAQSVKARGAVIPWYFCPSRERTFWDSKDPGNERPAGALGDYACASGDGDPNYLWTGPDANGAIILGKVLQEKDGLIQAWESRTSLASLTRGQKFTILVGEKHLPQNRLGETSSGDGPFYDGSEAGFSARIGGPGYGLAQSPLTPYNSNFGSAHPGICQFLRADGSLLRRENSFDEKLLGALIRR